MTYTLRAMQVVAVAITMTIVSVTGFDLYALVMASVDFNRILTFLLISVSIPIAVMAAYEMTKVYASLNEEIILARSNNKNDRFAYTAMMILISISLFAMTNMTLGVSLSTGVNANVMTLLALGLSVLLFVINFTAVKHAIPIDELR
jgi:hypothetical protein